MSHMIRRIIIFLIFAPVLVIYNESYAQVTKSHDIGKLWETMFSTGTIPRYAPLQYQMSYPGGDFRLQSRKNLNGI